MIYSESQESPLVEKRSLPHGGDEDFPSKRPRSSGNSKQNQEQVRNKMFF